MNRPHLLPCLQKLAYTWDVDTLLSSVGLGRSRHNCRRIRAPQHMRNKALFLRPKFACCSMAGCVGTPSGVHRPTAVSANPAQSVSNPFLAESGDGSLKTVGIISHAHAIPASTRPQSVQNPASESASSYGAGGPPFQFILKKSPFTIQPSHRKSPPTGNHRGCAMNPIIQRYQLNNGGIDITSNNQKYSIPCGAVLLVHASATPSDGQLALWEISGGIFAGAYRAKAQSIILDGIGALGIGESGAQYIGTVVGYSFDLLMLGGKAA